MRVHCGEPKNSSVSSGKVPARARAWTRFPYSSFPRNEGVPGSSPGVRLLEISSARAAELLLHATVGMGAGLKLVERRLQAGERLFPAAAAPVEEAEVRNDLALVMIVAQLAEDGGGLLEAVERALIVAGVAERQREVVERHRLAASVAELADEFQSVRMGSNCPLRVAAPTKVDTASVELSGLPVWAGRWRRRGSRAPPPQVVGAVPRDQSAARETAPPGLEGTLNHPHAPSNSAGQGVVSARARDDDNPTGEGEEREKDEGDELAEADGGEEAEDKEHEAYECGEALAQAHTVRGRLERDARACDDAFSPHVHGVTDQLHPLLIKYIRFAASRRGPVAPIAGIRRGAPVSLRVLVPAFRLNQRRYALALPVPVRRATIAEGEAIDVDEPVVIMELDDAAEHRDGAVPVPHVEHRDGYSRVVSHVGQSQPLEVHVDEKAAVVPVVPGRGRIGSAIRADGGNDGGVRLLQELDELGGKRCRWQGASLRPRRSVPDAWCRHAVGSR
jgi:hypothetical protein